MKVATNGRRRVLPIALAIVAVVLVGAGLWWAKWQTYHFAAVDPGVLYRAGNRGVREFGHAIGSGKIKTVVCLIDDTELADTHKPEFAAEVEWCRRNGVKIERIPVKLGGWPTSDDVRQFLSVVADKRNQPVLVHCAQGVRRTGMMVAAYQRSVLGWAPEKCAEQMLTFGHSQRTVGDVKRFIEVYDPGTGAVPEGLPVGQE